MATPTWDAVAGATIMAGAEAAIAVGTNQQAQTFSRTSFLEATIGGLLRMGFPESSAQPDFC